MLEASECNKTDLERGIRQSWVSLQLSLTLSATLGKPCDLSDFSFLMVVRHCEPPGTLQKPLFQQGRMLGNRPRAFPSVMGMAIPATFFFPQNPVPRSMAEKRLFSSSILCTYISEAAGQHWTSFSAFLVAKHGRMTSSQYLSCGSATGVKAFHLQVPPPCFPSAFAGWVQMALNQWFSNLSV